MLFSRAIAFVGARTRALDAEFRTLIHNSSWIFLSNGVRTAIAFLKAIIIARGLGASGYGTYVVMFALTTTVREFFDLNINSAIIKFGADYRAQARGDKLVALLKGGLLLSACVAVLAVITAWALSLVAYERLIDVPGLRLYVLGFAVAVSMQLFDSMCFALLRLFYKFRLNSVLNVTLALVDLMLVAVVLWLFPRQLEPFLIAMMVATFLNSVIINVVAIWELWPDLRAHLQAPIRLLAPQRKELTTFILSNSGTRTLQNLMNRGDVLLLGFISNTYQVGLYEIGRRIAYAIVRLTDPIAVSIFPQTSKLIAEQKFAQLIKLLQRATAVLAIPAGLCVIVALALGNSGISVLLGPEFAGAATPLFIHMVAACLYAVVFWAAPVLLSLGRTVFRFVLAGASLILGTSIALVLGPVYGASGVAVGSLVAKCTLLLVSAAVAYRALRARAGSIEVSAVVGTAALREV